MQSHNVLKSMISDCEEKPEIHQEFLWSFSHWNIVSNSEDIWLIYVDWDFSFYKKILSTFIILMEKVFATIFDKTESVDCKLMLTIIQAYWDF